MSAPHLTLPVHHLAEAVKSAGTYLWGEANKNAEISSQVKSDNSLVLNLDLESEKVLKDKLGKELPLVSEEEVASHLHIGKAQDYYLIDPVDGTTSCKRFFRTCGGQIGFGPLGGYVREGKLHGAAFFNVPQRALFVAERGIGSYCIEFADREIAKKPLDMAHSKRLFVEDTIPLIESAVLFFAGTNGELQVVEKLKKQNLIENLYRFGGFANDCSRLARGIEQVQVQFSVRAWDLPGALLSELAGYSVIIDPKKSRTPLASWQVAEANPMVAALPSSIQKLLSLIE